MSRRAHQRCPTSEWNRAHPSLPASVFRRKGAHAVDTGGRQYRWPMHDDPGADAVDFDRAVMWAWVPPDVKARFDGESCWPDPDDTTPLRLRFYAAGGHAAAAARAGLQLRPLEVLTRPRGATGTIVFENSAEVMAIAAAVRAQPQAARPWRGPYSRR